MTLATIEEIAFGLLLLGIVYRIFIYCPDAEPGGFRRLIGETWQAFKSVCRQRGI